MQGFSFSLLVFLNCITLGGALRVDCQFGNKVSRNRAPMQLSFGSLGRDEMRSSHSMLPERLKGTPPGAPNSLQHLACSIHTQAPSLPLSIFPLSPTHPPTPLPPSHTHTHTHIHTHTHQDHNWLSLKKPTTRWHPFQRQRLRWAPRSVFGKLQLPGGSSAARARQILCPPPSSWGPLPAQPPWEDTSPAPPAHRGWVCPAKSPLLQDKPNDPGARATETQGATEANMSPPKGCWLQR